MPRWMAHPTLVGSLLGRKLERKEKSIKKHLKQASKKKDIDNVSITKDINSVLPSSHTMDILVNTSMVFKKSKKTMNTRKKPDRKPAARA